MWGCRGGGLSLGGCAGVWRMLFVLCMRGIVWAWGLQLVMLGGPVSGGMLGSLEEDGNGSADGNRSRLREQLYNRVDQPSEWKAVGWVMVQHGGKGGNMWWG